MSKQTPLQQAIEQIEQMIINCRDAIKSEATPNKEHYVSKKGGLSQALSIITSLLPIERSDIEGAYDAGNNSARICNSMGETNLSEQYFEKTYGTPAEVDKVMTDEEYVKSVYPDAKEWVSEDTNKPNHFLVRIIDLPSEFMSDWVEESQAAWESAAQRIGTKSKRYEYRNKVQNYKGISGQDIA